MINKVFLNIFLCMSFFLSGCAGSVRVSMKDCPQPSAQFAHVVGKNTDSFHGDHSFTTKFWSYGILANSPTQVELKDILVDHGFNCVNIEYMRYTLGQSFWDQVFSVVPLIQRSSIKIELALKDKQIK